MIFSVPSKTFIVGEYHALNGGLSLVACTGPRFTLKATRAQSTQPPFHPHSPAGRWATRHRPLLQDLQLHFTDPHQNQGGLGRSSAEFCLLWALTQTLQNANPNAPPACHTDYLSCLNTPASGVDVLAQQHGGLCALTSNHSIHQVCIWPWEDIDFLIVRTGHNLPTHQHLQTFNYPDTQELGRCAKLTVNALLAHQLTRFCDSVNTYGDQLEQLDLSCKPTQILRRECAKLEGVLAVKGCGAMGADTLLLVIQRARRADLMAWLNAHSRLCVATQSDLSHGLHIEGSLDA